jgi:iron complex transport system substrate-binding protein
MVWKYILNLVSCFIIVFPSFSWANSPLALRPEKIVSLNLCLDGLLLSLVEPDRINSLTYLSADPQYSSFSLEAKRFFLNHGLAEEIAMLKPDLILAGDFGANDSILLLRKLGFHIEQLPLPLTVQDITAQIRRFGELVGSQNAAEKMAVDIETKLAALDETQRRATKLHSRKLNAFWYSSNGVVVGKDTLETELMERAGFHNLALDLHITGFSQLDLEDLLVAKPDVIIMELAEAQAFSLALEYTQHPALKKKGVSVITLPTTLSVCSAPVVADVINELNLRSRQLYDLQ